MREASASDTSVIETIRILLQNICSDKRNIALCLKKIYQPRKNKSLNIINAISY